MKKAALGAITAVTFIVLSLAGCGSDDGYATIDPSLLPPLPADTYPIDDPSANASDLPSASPTSVAFFSGQVVDESPRDLPSNFSTYASVDGKVILVEEGKDIPQSVVDDMSASVNSLPVVENAKSVQDFVIISAWIDDIDKRLFAATGMHAAVVYTYPSISSVDSKDSPQAMWGFRVAMSSNETFQSQPVATQADAIAAAEKWIASEANDPSKYTVVSGSAL